MTSQRTFFTHLVTGDRLLLNMCKGQILNVRPSLSQVMTWEQAAVQLYIQTPLHHLFATPFNLSIQQRKGQAVVKLQLFNFRNERCNLLK